MPPGCLRGALEADYTAAGGMAVGRTGSRRDAPGANDRRISGAPMLDALAGDACQAAPDCAVWRLRHWVLAEAPGFHEANPLH